MTIILFSFLFFFKVKLFCYLLLWWYCSAVVFCFHSPITSSGFYSSFSPTTSSRFCFSSSDCFGSYPPLLLLDFYVLFPSLCFTNSLTASPCGFCTHFSNRSHLLFFLLHFIFEWLFLFSM